MWMNNRNTGNSVAVQVWVLLACDHKPKKGERGRWNFRARVEARKISITK